MNKILTGCLLLLPVSNEAANAGIIVMVQPSVIATDMLESERLDLSVNVEILSGAGNLQTQPIAPVTNQSGDGDAAQSVSISLQPVERWESPNHTTRARAVPPPVSAPGSAIAGAAALPNGETSATVSRISDSRLSAEKLTVLDDRFALSSVTIDSPPTIVFADDSSPGLLTRSRRRPVESWEPDSAPMSLITDMGAMRVAAFGASRGASYGVSGGGASFGKGGARHSAGNLYFGPASSHSDNSEKLYTSTFFIVLLNIVCVVLYKYGYRS